MYSSDRDELEDELYRGDHGDSEDSEIDSELEFRLYSQLHYSAHAEETETEEGKNEDDQRQDVDCQQEVQQPVSNLDLLHEHLQVRAAKANKIKNKTPIRDQKPFRLEEVIVIDSGPDVITVSEDDTANDEDSVCARKGQPFSRVKTSKPSQQKPKKELGLPEIVELSSSDSDSESPAPKSCPDTSDSDSLENWMILGQDREDGDLSISLNLDDDHEADDDDDEEETGRGSRWVVSSKDREARISNKERSARITGLRDPRRYYTNKNVQCRNCDGTGHLSKNCSEPKKASPCFLCGTVGHISSDCPYKHCNNCGLPGHLYGDCSEKAYWHKQCHRCGMKGHFIDVCPEIWRQYHITIHKGPPVKQTEEENDGNSGYCYNCSKRGHHGYACTQKRMFNGSFPSIPFIKYYDNSEDAKRREVRVRMKVKELKWKGFFLEGSKIPEPPKKKLRVHEGAGPRHSNYQSKPKGSHVFFTDEHEDRSFKKNKSKPPPCSGSVKPWKPKRPVPKSKGLLNQGKLIIDEAADFPRGGVRHGGNIEKRRKHKKGPRLDFGNAKPGRPPWKGSAEGKELKKEAKKEKRNQKRRISGKKLAGLREPSDENLFCIKQRKSRKRSFL